MSSDLPLPERAALWEVLWGWAQLCTKGILLKVENASKSAPTEHSMPKVIVQQTRGASPMEDSDVTEQDVKKKKPKY